MSLQTKKQPGPVFGPCPLPWHCNLFGFLDGEPFGPKGPTPFNHKLPSLKRQTYYESVLSFSCGCQEQGSTNTPVHLPSGISPADVPLWKNPTAPACRSPGVKMPYVGDGDDIQPARKRRRDDDHDGNVYRFYSPDKQHDIYFVNPAADFAAARKILPLSAKRARIATDDHLPHHNTCSFAPSHRRRPSQQKVLQGQPGLENRAPGPPSAALLAPCYICHRRPTKKSDLDSFAECQGCGERACFVCIRQCYGWNADGCSMSVLSEQEVLSRSFHMDDADDMEPEHRDKIYIHNENKHSETWPMRACFDKTIKDTRGWAASGHRSVVCSRCCIEKGRQGEVVCLGCLSGMVGV